MTYLMGVDLGSTSLKANVYNIEGELIASGSKPTEISYLSEKHPEWAFWEPDKFWNDTALAIKEAVSQLKNPKRIKGLAVTGFGMDGLPLDQEGTWLYPFISWHCSRTEPLSRKWSQEIGARKIFSVTGKQVMPIDTIYRMMWIKKHYPEILDKTDTWLLAEGYINYKLCGEKVTDFSMASCTSVLDQKEGKWSEDLISKAGINMEIFPEILPSGTRLGKITNEASSKTGLQKNTSVILGGHDYLCAALGVGAFIPEIVLDINGTWEMVLQSSKKPLLVDEVFEAGLTVDRHVAEDKFASVGTAVSANMTEWFRRNYGKFEKKLAKKHNKSEWDLLMEKAKDAPIGSNGTFFLPHFSGAGTPINDSRSLGAFIGLSDLAGKNEMIRALIEGLNYQTREMIEGLENALGEKANKIVAVGGATKNEFWMNNKSNITGKTIEVSGVKEATSLGAAILAGLGLDIYKNEEDAYNCTFKSGKIYEPDVSQNNKYQDYYKIFKEIYPSLKNLNHKIYEHFKY